MAQRQTHNVRRHEICSFHLSPLADVKVLAIGAKPVTTSRSDREYLGPRHVVDYRLLLDRINMPSDHLSIDQELEFSTNVLSDPAKANLSLGNVAVSSACCASDS